MRWAEKAWFTRRRLSRLHLLLKNPLLLRRKIREAACLLSKPKGKITTPSITISPDFVILASIHVTIKEQVSLTLMREGGLKSMELKGDMNLQITDATQAQIKILLAAPTIDFGSDLQFKQHPKVAKFGAERVIALADTSRAFPVGQSIAVLRWRYAGKDESYVPLSSMGFLCSYSHGS